jgi:hypothetical protein
MDEFTRKKYIENTNQEKKRKYMEMPWYKKRRVIAFYVILGLIVLIGYLSLRNKTSSTPALTSIKPSPAVEIKKVEEIPFALSLSNLSPNYQGSDIETVYNSIHQQTDTEKQSKGEFETTEEYTKRIKSLKSNTFGIFAFKRDINSKYNADEEVFYISLNIDTFVGMYDSSIKRNVKEYLEIKKKSTENEKYVGQNAFGATTEVTNVTNSIYGLTIGTFVDNFKTLRREKGGPLSFNIKIPRDRAVAIKEDIMALIIYEPQSTSYEWNGSLPTIDKPTQSKDNYYGLEGKLIAIWIYNKQTGEILLKKDIESSKKSFGG